MALTITLSISGANQGMGYVIARKPATEQKNYQLLLMGRDLKKDDDSVIACTTAIEKQFGQLNVLINNVGIGAPSLNSEPTLQRQFARCLDRNGYGAACIAEACIPLIKNPTILRVILMTGRNPDH